MMTLSQVREMYPEAPGYSDEVGRFVGENGATYRAMARRHGAGYRP